MASQTQSNIGFMHYHRRCPKPKSESTVGAKDRKYRASESRAKVNNLSEVQSLTQRLLGTDGAEKWQRSDKNNQSRRGTQANRQWRKRQMRQQCQSPEQESFGDRLNAILANPKWKKRRATRKRKRSAHAARVKVENCNNVEMVNPTSVDNLTEMFARNMHVSDLGYAYYPPMAEHNTAVTKAGY
jgi:hypothetical protein